MKSTLGRFGLPDLVVVLVLFNEVSSAQFVVPVQPSYTRDLFLFYLVAGFAVGGRFWSRADRRAVVAAVVMAALVLAGNLSWFLEHDWGQANNYWGSWRLFAAVILFGLAYGGIRWRVWQMILVGAALLIAALQAIALLFGLTRIEAFTGGEAPFYWNRPLAASSTMLLVVGFILLSLSPPRRASVALISFLGISVVLAQNRSCWVALIVALALCSIASYRMYGFRCGQLRAALAVVGFWALSLLIPLVAGWSVLPGYQSLSGGEGLLNRLPASATSDGSLDWRFAMWDSRIHVSRTLDDWLFGGAFGVTAARGPGSSVMNPFNSAHNLLLDQFIMLGFFGLMAFAVLLSLSLFRRGAGLDALNISLYSLLGFGAFYNWPVWTGLLLGAGGALAKVQESGGSQPGEMAGVQGSAPPDPAPIPDS